MDSVQYSLDNVSNIYLTKCAYLLIKIQMSNKLDILCSFRNVSNYLFVQIKFCPTNMWFVRDQRSQRSQLSGALLGTVTLAQSQTLTWSTQAGKNNQPDIGSDLAPLMTHALRRSPVSCRTCQAARIAKLPTCLNPCSSHIKARAVAQHCLI